MIHARGLTRHFRVKKETVVAVNGLDLDVEEGELVAFLGPNGAGKSTSLRLLTTLLPPTAGTATVAGHDIRSAPAAARERIGYIGQGKSSGDYFRVADELFSQGRCYGLSRAEARRRAGELLAVLDLEALGKRYANTLSGGQRRRLDIALGLIHRPKLLFMDEPSSGLDPQNRANLWEHILRLRREYGTTIFLTTHYLDEADAMAERVLVIDHGRVIADDTAANLKANLAGDLITVVVDEPRRAAELAPPAKEVLVDGELVTVRLAGQATAALPRFLRELYREGITVRSADLRRPTLDDVFLSLTGRSLRESDAA
ncbi:ATP-binding cassette domain-containing protein [Amycolatopsis sp. YIM 10]|uniref:ATP-binding cassette domain-containing protein n=1 Tax=Amycolatopsis sp. YIM 10 TaxID=2653857 RepID=UPI00128FEBE2|nr:ATP-binding cassette domain-containing protein [Amycolatopsis sp. YIM 10]QFU94632.1 Daunorubicin/doxorubicin resistance ATP-binding protein DrrA [Amycolatopsis sp. YIM 10]